MQKTYLGAISGTPGSYGIVFLDLPGCVSCGDTIDEVRAMGAEALSLHINSMLDFGDAIPEPTQHSMADVVAWLHDDDDDDDNGPWVELVPIDVEVPSPADTVTLRLQADLLKRIAEVATVRGIDFSYRQLVERAVEHELESMRKSAA